MTIEQKARDIAERVEEEHGSYWGLPEAARLGIIEGLEMGAKVAENAANRRFTKDMREMCELIAKQIRALIEEQKV